MAYRREKNMKLSKRLSGIEESATMKMGALANKLRSEGKKVLNFSLGEPDFNTPSFICDAAKKAMDLGYTHYTSSAGIPELREEIARKLNEENGIDVDAENIIVTSGAKQAIYEAVMAILDEGDAAILLDPAWVSYEEMIKMAGARPVWVKRLEEEVRYEELEEAIASNPKVKMIIINSPNNPVGYVFSEKELREIANFSLDHNLFVISDEIYEKIIYDRKHISIASFEGMLERTIVINGFSKTYAMTGWRIGYAAAPKEIIKGMLKIQQHSTTCASSISQFAALATFRSPDSEESVKAMVKEFKRRRDAIVKGLNRIGLRCLRSEGAFYAFANVPDLKEMDDIEFSELLLKEAHVVVTPGSAFGPSGRGFVRFSYATSLEDIVEGLERIRGVVEKYQHR
ncbi:MAG: pyridoxal phosphate-dependent aminotransferase [Candidatus Methanospirareceae archaeon]